MERVTARPGRSRALALLAVAALAIGPMLPPAPAVHAAATFTVNSIADPGDGACQPLPVGDCTLREAITAANTMLGADTIAFAIPGNGPHTIAPGSELPAVTDRVTIDGYTQGASTADPADDARVNTLAAGSNAVLKIELDGSGAGGVHGLTIKAARSTVRGLAINRFLRGIQIEGAEATGVVVAGNFLGTDPTGTLDRGNTADGLIVLGPAALVGGPTRAARNALAGNGADGISIGPGARGTTVQTNLIGLAADGIGTLPNDEDGVVVGGTATGNRILGNAIAGSGLLGINLRGGSEDARGVTANDPRDLDAGANRLQNTPVLAAATTTGAGTTISGRLESRPNRSYLIQFFANPAPDRNEGSTFLGERRLTTDGAGRASFAVALPPARRVPAGRFVTATATDGATGDTSEFSAPRPARRPG